VGSREDRVCEYRKTDETVCDTGIKRKLRNLMVELRNSAESAKESSKEDKAYSYKENPDVKTRNKFQKKAKSKG